MRQDLYRGETAEFRPNNDSGLLSSVNWLIEFWIFCCAGMVRNTGL